MLSNIALAIARAVDESGYDGEQVLIDAGIDPKWAAQPDTRIPVGHHQQLWRLAIDRTQNPCLALKVGQALPPGAIHGLGLGWLRLGRRVTHFRASSHFTRQPVDRPGAARRGRAPTHW